MKRWVVEGEWSGYRSEQRRVCHRTVELPKRAREIAALHSIRFTDGTYLELSARQAKPRERVQIIRGYVDLINDCLREKVTSVGQLYEVRKAREAKDA